MEKERPHEHYTFGELVRQFRDRAHVSQQALARRLGVHRNTIVHWEQGNYLPKTRTAMRELAQALHLTEQETTQLLGAASFPTHGQPDHPVVSVVWHIPYLRNPFFTGQDALLAEMQRVLAPKRAMTHLSALALVGLAGIGKTQLAVEYAYQHAEQYTAILWINAEAPGPFMASVMAIGERLHLLPQNQKHTQQQAISALRTWLEHHRDWLVILDNVDTLSLVVPLLPTTRHGALLLTTRQQACSSLAHPLQVEAMSLEDGMRLLLQRAGGAGAADNPCDEDIARTIVQALGGLPLALDQAGAYMEETHCGLRAYWERYQSHTKMLLAQRGRGRWDYPHSVDATLSLAFERVKQEAPSAAGLLLLCAFLHPEAVPEELLTENATQFGTPLAPLVTDLLQFDAACALLGNASLLRRHGGTRTFRLHRLVQVVLRSHLDEATQRIWAEQAVRCVNACLPEGDPWSPEGRRRWSRLLSQTFVQVQWIAHYQMLSPEAARLLYILATFCHERGLYSQALELLQQTLKLRQALLGDAQLETAEVLNDLGVVHWYLGEYRQAEPHYEQALQMYNAQLGWEDPHTAHTMHNLAVLWLDQGKYAQAEEMEVRVLATRRRQLGEGHLQVAESLCTLASLACEQNQWTQAEALYQQGYAIRREALGEVHPLIAQTLGGLARLCLERGEDDRALEMIHHAQFLCEQTQGADHPRMAHYWQIQAELFLRQGQREQAKQLLERTLTLRQQYLPSGHPHLASTLALLADLAKQQGKGDSAESY